MASASVPSCQVVTGLVINIPPTFGSADLRRFFTDFVENDSFRLFHYKRRPLVKLVSDLIPQSILEDSVPPLPNCIYNKNCGLLKIQQEKWQRLVDKYHQKPWFGRDEVELESSCLLIKTPSGLCLSSKCVELSPPPPLTPKGNVGTSSSHFRHVINSCKMPASLIRKLGLSFSETKGRKYSNVPPPESIRHKDFSERCETKREHLFNDKLKRNGSSEEVKDETIIRERIQSRKLRPPTIRLQRRVGDAVHSARYGDDLGEEWERHNSLNDDVSARRVIQDEDQLECQPGTKERLFEEEMEVTWEKGGSGLVFYTDAQYWHGQKEDDERNVDDWDVDTSIYYDGTAGGDMDSKNMQEIRRSNDLRDGKMALSLFERPKRESPFRGNSFARKVMRYQGWRAGQGLGASNSGIRNPVESRGQVDRLGLGYRQPVKVWKRKRR